MHSCGFLQPLRRSLAHSTQVQARFGMCTFIWAGCAFVDVCIRSATVLAWWFLKRHLAGMLVRGRGLALMWYHAGSRALILGAIRSASRLVLYFLAVFIILMMLLVRYAVLGPQVGGSQHCMYCRC